MAKNSLVRVEVNINNFHDKENFNKEITIVRNRNEMKIKGKLLMKGDKYFVSKERAIHLKEKNIVTILKDDKEEAIETQSTEQ